MSSQPYPCPPVLAHRLAYRASKPCARFAPSDCNHECVRVGLSVWMYCPPCWARAHEPWWQGRTA